MTPPLSTRPPARGERSSRISRRLVLSAAIAAPALSGCVGGPRFAADPFTLGVASGEPAPDGFVLWTRLLPAPPSTIEVEWLVASDESMRTIVRRGTALATPEVAHSLHVELAGLEPDRPYWYRFRAGDAESPIGRTRTAPTPGAAAGERLRFAFASCQQYEQGWYSAYRHMASEDLDLVVFLGDYIYESSWGRDHVRKHGSVEPFDLAEYRERYAVYKSDPDLQRAHALFPWIVTWDDHEVSNDYANDRAEYNAVQPRFATRRAAAYQAFWEHMPLRNSRRPQNGVMPLYRSLDFGGLARFIVLDDRQYRDHQVCPRPERGGGSNVVGPDCPARLDRNLSLLGRDQEAWAETTLASSPARWNVIAQQTLMAPLDRGRGAAPPMFWTDGWDGYPAARQRLLEAIAARRPANPIVIGGDVHCHYVADLAIAPGGRPVATEFCGTSITSDGPSPERTPELLSRNPHVKLVEPRWRGYVSVALTPGRAEASLMALDNVRDPKSAIRTFARYAVENGNAGALPDKVPAA